MAQAMTQIDRSTAIIEGFSGLTVVRQIGLMIVFAASIAVGVGGILYVKEPNYAPLYHDVSYQDANEIVQVLNANEIKYQLDTDNKLILVEHRKIHQARLQLAAAGISSSERMGYDLLDQKSQLGTSQFIEKAKYHRSLEGELAKTIGSIQVVKFARVHIAIPKKTVFISDRRRPSASVFLELQPGRLLEPSQVEAITNLVASSIPELSEKSVTVLDQKGNLLSHSRHNDEVQQASKHLEYVQKIEDKYVARVHNILEPIIGLGQFKVEVTADIDFTRQTQTAEMFNPDNEAIRSEQILDEQQYGRDEMAGVPGALANQPPEVAEIEGQDNVAADDQLSNARRQTSRNYELDRTIRYVEQSVGQVRKLSVAVVINDKPAIANTAETAEQPVAADTIAAAGADNIKKTLAYTQEELNLVTALVKDAIGFDVNRGDRVMVINQPFRVPAEEAIEPLPDASILEAPWFETIIKMVGGVILTVVLVFGFLKPMMNRLANQGQTALAINDSLQVEDPIVEEEEVAAPIEENEILLPGPGESYEAQLNAVKNMVVDDPRRVAQVVKTWLAPE